MNPTIARFVDTRRDDRGHQPHELHRRQRRRARPRRTSTTVSPPSCRRPASTCPLFVVSGPGQRRRSRCPRRHRGAGERRPQRRVLRADGRDRGDEVRQRGPAARSSERWRPMSGSGYSAFDCPGHQGGQFFMRHPAGRRLVEFFGENAVPRRPLQRRREHGRPTHPRGCASTTPRQHAATVFNSDKHLLRAQRHLRLQQGRPRRSADAGRRRPLRPQQPQVHPPRRAVPWPAPLPSTSRPPATPSA